MYLATSPDVEEKHIKGQYYVSKEKKGHILLSTYYKYIIVLTTTKIQVPIAKHSSSNGFSKSKENTTKLWNITENILKEKVPGGDYIEAII